MINVCLADVEINLYPILWKLVVCITVHLYCIFITWKLLPLCYWGKLVALPILGYETFAVLYLCGTIILYCIDGVATTFLNLYHDLQCPHWLITILDFKNLHSLVKASFTCMTVYFFVLLMDQIKPNLSVVILSKLLLVYYIVHVIFCIGRVLVDILYSALYVYHLLYRRMTEVLVY